MKYNFQVSMLAMLFVSYVSLFQIDNLPNSDELDYLDAIEAGFLENYLEGKSISSFEFFDSTVQKFLNHSEINIWQLMLQKKDVMAARHFHGPASFYAYTLLGVSTVKSLRILSVCLSLVFIGLISLILPKSDKLIYLLVLLIISLYLLSSGQSLAITPHLAYAIIALGTLYSLDKFLLTKNLRYWYLACALCAVALTTLEYSIVLLATLGFVLFLNYKNGISFKRLVFIRSIGIFLLTCTLVWPAGVLKLKIFVSYAKYLYAAFFSNYYQTFSESIIFRSPGILANLILFIFGSLLVLFQNSHNKRINLKIYLFYGVILFLLNLPNHFIYQQYVFSFMPFILISSAFMFIEIAVWSRLYQICVALILILAIFINAGELSANILVRKEINQSQKESLANISNHLIGLKKVLLLGYPNYVADRNLNWNGELSVLNPDIENIKELEKSIKTKQIQLVIYLKNSDRVFTKVSANDLENWLRANYKILDISSDYIIFKLAR